MVTGSFVITAAVPIEIAADTSRLPFSEQFQKGLDTHRSFPSIAIHARRREVLPVTRTALTDRHDVIERVRWLPAIRAQRVVQRFDPLHRFFGEWSVPTCEPIVREPSPASR